MENSLTNGDIVRRLNDVGLASLLSSLKHSADYESNDYDPLMLEWVQKEAEPGMVSLLEGQPIAISGPVRHANHRYEEMHRLFFGICTNGYGNAIRKKEVAQWLDDLLECHAEEYTDIEYRWREEREKNGLHRYKPGDEMPGGWYWVWIPHRAKLGIVEFDDKMKQCFAAKPEGWLAWGPILEPGIR